MTRGSSEDGLRGAIATAVTFGAVLGASVATSAAAMAPCKPLGCSTVDVGPYEAPAGWRFVPDRRPVAVIPLGNAMYNLNEAGIVGWWYAEGTNQDDGAPYGIRRNGVPDALDELIMRLDDLYALGFRRIQLRLPAGNLDEDQPYADSSQWWTMPSWKRTRITDVVGGWIAAKEAAGDPVTMSVYGGYKVADPCSLGMDDSHPPDFTNPTDACLMYQNIKPWMDVGIKEYWFDNSGPFWEDLIKLQHSSNYSEGSGSSWRAKIKLGGEAVPSTTGNCATSPSTVKVPEPGALAGTAWIATYRFARSRYTYNNTFRTFNPNTTEVGLLLSGHATPGLATPCGPAPHNSPKDKMWDFVDVKKFYDRGWVLWCYASQGSTVDYDLPNGESVEIVMRIYDFGEIASLADFDGDGEMNIADLGKDYLDFVAAWTANLLTLNPKPTYLMGDVNGDNFVDFEDMTAFLTARDSWNLLGLVESVNLGVPPWVP